MLSILRISPRLFVLLSLTLISLMVSGTGLVLSGFFRQAIIDREGKIISDFAHALASREIAPGDFENFVSDTARLHFSRSFGIMHELGEVVRIELFDLSGLIVWSDDINLIGTHAPHTKEISRAASGGSTVVFYEDVGSDKSATEIQAPSPPFVEFFVPISIHKNINALPEVAGVMAIYRSSSGLNATLQRGTQLVWLVTATGGIVLFGALFALFRSVWQGREEAESRLMQLSSEHQRIIHLEKLSATGAMVAEIAHQINNPLVGVINLAELADREAENPAQVRALLTDIQNAGKHCRDFVRRMLDFTKAARCELQTVSLLSLVKETVYLFQDSTQGHPNIEMIFPEGPGNDAVIHADPVLFRHALFNLLNNAHQASPETPITIKLEKEKAASASMVRWRLEVIDHGPGISEESRPLVFTPFFTTKAGGMGLGLSVVQQIVMQHGGDLAIKDTPGGGARVLLWFPENALAGGRE